MISLQKTDFDKEYKELIKAQHKISGEFTVIEAGVEVSHIDDEMLDFEDERPDIHYLKLPTGYVLTKCQFKSGNIKFFIIKVG